MRISPIDIQQHKFKSRLLGYDTASVDRFLEMLAEEIERQHQRNQDLGEELARARSVLDELRQREKALQATLVTAHQAAEDLKSNARKEAELIIVDAKLQAERIVREADERRIQLIGEIHEIKRQKIAFESSLRNMIESHTKLLDLEVLELPVATGRLEEPLPFDRPVRRQLGKDVQGQEPNPR